MTGADDIDTLEEMAVLVEDELSLDVRMVEEEGPSQGC